MRHWRNPKTIAFAAVALAFYGHIAGASAGSAATLVALSGFMWRA